MSEWRALRAGESVLERRRVLARAHERFVEDQGITEDPEELQRFVAETGIRPAVMTSWLRSHRADIDPDRVREHPDLDPEELAELRRIHPLGHVLPVIERLLVQAAGDSGLIIAVGDAAGRLLWIDGDVKMRTKAEEIGFRAGMDWSESAVGTSAPGSALELDHAIQVLGAEHYHRSVHQWSCTAAPVHDPMSGAIVGVLDVTGGDDAASPHILPLVEATLAAVEAEMKLEAMRSRYERERSRPKSAKMPAAVTPRLVVLGREPALLETGEGSIPLTGRHAEILLTLSQHQGLGAAALAEEVYGSAEFDQTLRAEVVRLRKHLDTHGAGLGVLSRPYRLDRVLRVDAVEALEAIARGAHRLALASYEGPVLPSSEAPAVLQIRQDVDATLRQSMLQHAGTDVLFAYAQQWGEDDVEVWQTLLQVLPPLSPKRARVVAHLDAMRR